MEHLGMSASIHEIHSSLPVAAATTWSVLENDANHSIWECVMTKDRVMGTPLWEGSVFEENVCSCRRRGKVRREDRSHEKAGLKELEQHTQHRREVPSDVSVEVKQVGKGIRLTDSHRIFCSLCFRKYTQGGPNNGAQRASQSLEL